VEGVRRGVVGERGLSRTIWAVSLPLLLVYVSETVVHVTDTAFLGRVGSTELAALALVYTLYEVLVVPVAGLADAMQIVIARRLGQHRDDGVRATFRHGVLLILAVSTALAAVLHVAAPIIGDGLARSPDVAAAVTDFLRIAAYGVVPSSLWLGYAALYVGLARTAVLAWSTILLATTNLVLSYGLILGELGMPRLGIKGAAWSFVVAETTTFLFLTVFTASKGWLRRNRSRGSAAAEGATLRPLLWLAPPVAMSALVQGLRWLAFFMIIEAMGEEALAWSNIIYACSTVFLIPAYAVGESVTSLVSNVIGRGRAGDVTAVTRRSTIVVLLITAPVALLAVLAPEKVISVFTDDQAIIAGAAPSLSVLAVTMVLVVPAEVWSAAVAGTGATYVALGIELVLTVVLLACTYAAAVTLGLPLAYEWASMGVAALVGLAMSHWWLASKRVRILD
jgi:putative MATE family efflux protein